MVRAYESDKGQVWTLLSKAGLLDIPTDQFSQRVREAKKAVMERLSELLEVTTDVGERDSTAYSLATLKKLEATLKRNETPRGSE